MNIPNPSSQKFHQIFFNRQQKNILLEFKASGQLAQQYKSNKNQCLKKQSTKKKKPNTKNYLNSKPNTELNLTN